MAAFAYDREHGTPLGLDAAGLSSLVMMPRPITPAFLFIETTLAKAAANASLLIAAA